MKKKLSPARKRLLYALVGSSLFWHMPALVSAEDMAETAATGQTAAQADASAALTDRQRVFTLEGVEVTASRQTLSPAYAGGQVARGANLGVLGNRDFMDTPFNVASYTARIIEDQQANTLYDVLINDPSVRFTTPTGQAAEYYKIRGLDVAMEHLYFNGMSGLAPYYRVPVEFLERVDVLKGPGSLLYGGVNASVGGAINLAPKRADEEDLTNFTASYTSSSHLGGHLDIGRRFGKNKEWGVRFNGLYADGDTETDGQSKERLLGALGVDYRSDRWRLSLDAYGSQDYYENGLISMYQLQSNHIKAPHGSTNLFKGTSGAARNNGILFKGEYDLQDNLTTYFGFGQAASRATGFINGNHILLVQADGTAYPRNLFKQNFWNDATSAELGLRGAYQTGSVKHQLVLSSSFLDNEYSSTFNRYVPTPYMSGFPISIYDDSYSFADLFDSVSWTGKGGKTTTSKLSSFLLADTLSFNEEKVQLTLGLRRQSVKTENFIAATGARTAKHDDDKTLPVVGFVAKPWGDSVALYGNYIKALSPGDQVLSTSGYTNAGQLMAPYTSKQTEIGVKWDRGNFANTLALFQINKPNTMVVTNSLDEKTQTYDGEQESRGVEWSTFGQIAENVRILGGITYLRGEITKAASAATKGNTPFGVPKWTMNAGVEWDTPWNKDLTLSLRAVYTDSQYINNANTIKLPSWVRYDLGARYKTEINNTPVTYRLSVENLLDKKYWAGAFSMEGFATLGGPRTVKLSATMQF
ncbi:TonB-dependent siderophore receptor|uniref:Iron complex outermembrane recepter protein n=1 Tax=Dendrosporobacter quercicolus TaxID=146817 RepID=A0A1G9TTS1_9FIRM|nr:TonB-dependent siderophore receptor [Dendrosporobacter quercicolus]NSL48853.1 TonB-dependent siderophore receptor [Dendrosporobacter quercicolus DSM 1736]SDM51127.1 iron complex outermembrane recepter protein [Dendrosporobacter quercicolus]